jgi:hypothetical protein
MTADTERDWLDDVLTQTAAVEENGFNRRVMAALPPAPPQARLRAAVITVFTLAACAIALLVLPAGQFISDALFSLFETGTWTSPSLAAIALGGLACAAWLTYSAATAES